MTTMTLEWIDVQDRMPNTDEIVLVYSIHPNQVGTYTATYDPSDLEDDGSPSEYVWECTWNNLLQLKYVTHWMLIPPPPLF